MFVILNVVIVCMCGIAITGCARVVHDVNKILRHDIKLRWKVFPYVMYATAGYLFGCAAYMLFTQKGW